MLTFGQARKRRSAAENVSFAAVFGVPKRYSHTCDEVHSICKIVCFSVFLEALAPDSVQAEMKGPKALTIVIKLGKCLD